MSFYLGNIPKGNDPNLFERSPTISKAMRNAATRRNKNAQTEARVRQEQNNADEGVSPRNRRLANLRAKFTERRAKSAKKLGRHKSRARLAMEAEINALTKSMGATSLGGRRRTRR